MVSMYVLYIYAHNIRIQHMHMRTAYCVGLGARRGIMLWAPIPLRIQSPENPGGDIKAAPAAG